MRRINYGRKEYSLEDSLGTIHFVDTNDGLNLEKICYSQLSQARSST